MNSNNPSQKDQQEVTLKTFREIAKLGFKTEDAQKGKMGDLNVLFFDSKGDKSKNEGKDQKFATLESMKQIETIAKTFKQGLQLDKTPRSELIGLSFNDGKDRIDIKDIKGNAYMVNRTEDHAFLKDKKTLRSEKWAAEDMNAAIDQKLMAQVETFSYTSKKFPYELQEMVLRNNGLVDIQRTDSGSLLTFDHPVTRSGLNLDNLSPTPETEAKMQKMQSAEQTSPAKTEEPLKQQEKISPMLKQFYDLKAKHPDALLLFRCGDFYETYQQDAQKASSILGITLTKNNNRKDPDGKPLEMAGFPFHALDSYLPKLIRAGLRVAICDQLPDPKLTRNKTEQVPDQSSPQPDQNTNDVNNSQGQNNVILDKQTLIAKIDEIIGKNQGVMFSSETPLMVKTTKGVEFEVNKIMREKDDSLRLYGIDNQNKERSVNIQKVDDKNLNNLLSNLIRIPASDLKTLDKTQTEENKQEKQKDEQTHESNKKESLGSEARKILTLSKLHEKTKKEHPSEMVFIRLRDYDTKKFMYQTFGKDADLLSTKISPSVEIIQPEIKGKQRPVVSLYQENIAAVKANLMNHNIYPVIINAKGENIDNDHFLAFSQEDRQAFLTQQTAVDGRSAQSTKPEKETITSPSADNQQSVQNTQTTSPQTDAPHQQQSTNQSTAQPTVSSAASQQADNNPSTDIKTSNASGIEREKEKNSRKNKQLTLDFPIDALIQYDVHKNSHVAGMYDIRLYINGEKAGAHRLSKEDRDKWFAHQFPITDLMMKYFPKELEGVNLDKLTLYKADKIQKTEQQNTKTEINVSANNKTEKELLYEERANHYQTVSDQLKQQGKDAVVLLQMHSKDGKEFFQTFGEDARIAADFLGRKTLQTGENIYVSMTSQEVDSLKQKLGEERFVVENFDRKIPAQTVKQTDQNLSQTPNQPTNPKATDNTKTLPTVTDKSRIEYVIAPIMRFNKNTQEQERVPGMYALSIFTDGQMLGHKTLSKDERDLLNNKPGEITNIINAKFTQELQGVKLNFKQVHRPAVSDEQWNNKTLPNSMTLQAMPRMTRNNDTGKYELTAKVEGLTLGPKTMFRQDVNDFFDHARPAAEIVARVFREELKSLNSQNANQMSNNIRQNADELISLWQKAKQGEDDKKMAFIQREGKFGVFYQTFGEDAKNMSKITNRSLRVIDTDNLKNVVYANVPQEQIVDITKQLRKAGFQPFAVNSEGTKVNISEEQKIAPQKSLALTDGRRVDDINLRNVNGKWMMTANIDGKPLPEREITREDATIFKQGQQTMSGVVLKYYADDINPQQQTQNNKRNMGR